jgi:hypothetical protein
MPLGHRAVSLVPALLLLAAWGVGGTSPGVLSAPSEFAIATAPPPTVATVLHANLSIPLDLSNGTFAAGTHILSTYEFQVVTWPKGYTSITVWIGSVQASFPESTGGTFQETVPALQTTVTSTSLSNPNATIANATAPKGGLSFAQGTTATLSSQLLAVMVSAQWGTLKMNFRWEWASVTPSGVTNYSSWSGFQTFTPPENLTVLSDGPSQISPGQEFQV